MGSTSRATLDLSREVTVFVLSLGAPSYAACLQRLRAQDCQVTLERIEGVRPLSAALQQMIDRCRTPYFVQVDEDMLLHPHAIRLLHARMAAAPPEVATVVGLLHDVHLGCDIQGVKIARHAVAARYRWADEPVVIRRIERMAADGFRVQVIETADPSAPGPLGLHTTPATPAALFDRYRALERLRQTFPRRMDWVEPLPALLLARVMTEGRLDDMPALLGLLAGRAAGPLPAGAELRDGRATLSSSPSPESLARMIADTVGTADPAPDVS